MYQLPSVLYREGVVPWTTLYAACQFLVDTARIYIHTLKTWDMTSVFSILGTQPKSEDETARRKKTDEPSPDDIQRVEEEEDEASPKLVPVGQEEDENTFMASADDEQVIVLSEVCSDYNGTLCAGR